MKKVFVLVGMYLFIGLPFAAMAQKEQTLGEVVVTDQRLELQFEQTSKTMTIITAEQIKAMPAQSVADVLLMAAGVDVRQRGINGVQADVSIRGGTFDQVVVLINGQPFSDPQTGHHTLNLPIDLQSIARIEVIKGPAARAYGANGLAGAINIVTVAPKKDYLRLEYLTGANGYDGQQISRAFGKKDQRNYISLRREKSDGYRENTAFLMYHGFAQSQFEVGKRKLSLMGGGSFRNFGAHGFYGSPKQIEQHEQTQSVFAVASLPFEQKRWRITPKIYWRRGYDFYQYDRVSKLYNNQHVSQQIGLGAQGNYRLKENIQLGFGLDAQQLLFFSSNLGDHTRSTVSTFLDLRFAFGKFDITPGVNLTYFSDFGPFVFPGVDAGWAFNEKWKVYGNAGQTYRVPNFTDLYYKDPSNEGNPDLLPERALSYELGLRHLSYGVQANIALFSRRGQNLIDWSKPDTNSVWRPRNINQLITDGAEASVQFNLAQRLERKRFLIQQVGINYTYVTVQTQLSEALISRYALNQLQDQVQTSLRLRLPLSLSATVNHRFARRAAAKGIEDGFHVVDARVQFDFKLLQLYLDGVNLTNTQYTEVNQIPMPGRYFRGGIALKLGRLL